ncbi:MAG: hypothetical protein J7L20_03730 [Thermoplasmata archaeon]|nr:hypothetical protein [Thermoplasmata archaeon]
MIGNLICEDEMEKFVDWLPDLSEDEVYVVLLLVRGKEFREKHGFKGKDRCLKLEIVPGYLSDPKHRLKQVIKRLALIASHAHELYDYEKVENGKIIRYKFPKEAIAVMISPNPGRWIRATVEAISDFVQSMYQAFQAREREFEIVRRMDLRFKAYCMKYKHTLFHQIDVDKKWLIPRVERKIEEILGCIPAKVTTPNGCHFLVKVADFDKETAKRWFSEMPKFVNELQKEYGEKVVEIKKDFQEPVPGVLYRGFVPKFEIGEKV